MKSDLARIVRNIVPAQYRPIVYLTTLVQKRTGLTVRGGPFRGMRYVTSSVGSAYIPKLLGIYERELHEVIEEIVARTRSVAVVLGAGEGYYAVGLALRNRGLRVFAFEADPVGRRLLYTLAELNGVEQRVKILAKALPDGLRILLETQHPEVVICDVEGAERELLDPERVPGLRDLPVLVELHEFVRPGIGQLLVTRFSASHDIQCIRQCSRDRREFPFSSLGTAFIPKRYLDWAVSEWRPERMSWLWMTPRCR